MRLFKFFACSLIVFFFSQQLSAQMPGGAPQQQQQADFSDDDLATFVKVQEEVGTVQEKAQEQMIGEIEGAGLDINTFNQIMQAEQNPNSEYSPSAEEKEKYEQIMPKVQEINQGMQEKAMQTMQEEGMDPQQYQQIMMAYQRDPEVKQRIDDMMEN